VANIRASGGDEFPEYPTSQSSNSGGGANTKKVDTSPIRRKYAARIVCGSATFSALKPLEPRATRSLAPRDPPLTVVRFLPKSHPHHRRRRHIRRLCVEFIFPWSLTVRGGGGGGRIVCVVVSRQEDPPPATAARPASTSRPAKPSLAPTTSPVPPASKQPPPPQPPQPPQSQQQAPKPSPGRALLARLSLTVSDDRTFHAAPSKSPRAAAKESASQSVRRIRGTFASVFKCGVR
jgi:hypothetical protein